ncbi:ABC transporter permease subunit [uncultured Friedmanniella sp.]|uniref:ABC transporter permease subunit n=1 Tax=uncultured Friedmanniella sp. TaxID=335381 RepID=UPI0035CABDA6
MIALLRAELLRVRSRKLTWIALGCVLLIVALTQVAVYTSVRPLSNNERAQAQTNYEQSKADYDQHKDEYAKEAQDCIDQGNPPEACEYTEPQLEDYATRSVSSFSEMANLAVTVGVFVSGLALLFLSASLIGAEFSSGSMANWLSFVPQRAKVYASKLGALALVGMVATAVVSGLSVGLTLLVSRIAGASVSDLGKVDAAAARGIVIGLVAVVIGFSLAMLTRHTIAASGTLLGYFFLRFVFTIVMYAVPVLQQGQRFMPENNALALLNHGATYTTEVRVATADGVEVNTIEHTITLAQASVYWVVLVVVLLAVSYLVFRRRDVN